MNKLNKNSFNIKLLNNVCVVYSYKLKNILMFTKSSRKSMVFKSKVIFDTNSNSLVFNGLLEKNSKKLYLHFNFLKSYLFSVSGILKIKKLNLIGVGYKAVKKTSKNIKLLQLKLGYSHDIFFKIPQGVIVHCPKPTKIIMLSNCSNTLNNFSSVIKSFKIPEPYKGKGIFYFNENLKLKEGKRI